MLRYTLLVPLRKSLTSAFCSVWDKILQMQNVAACRRMDPVKLAVINALIARLAHSMEIWDSHAGLVDEHRSMHILYYFGTCRMRRNEHKLFLVYQIWGCSPSIRLVFGSSFMWCLRCSAHLLSVHECHKIFVFLPLFNLFLYRYLLAVRHGDSNLCVRLMRLIQWGLMRLIYLIIYLFANNVVYKFNVYIMQ